MTELTHTEHRDYTGAKLGMWLFLFTEILLFGGMFLLYSIYRVGPYAGISRGREGNEPVLGAVNTVILLTSSLTMALSISAVKQGVRTRSLVYQAATIILGLAFLVNKYLRMERPYPARLSTRTLPNCSP